MVVDVNLDIESLRTLLAVLDHGSMTRAAEWAPGVGLGELPLMYQVARIDPRDRTALTVALVEAIKAEVAEPAHA